MTKAKAETDSGRSLGDEFAGVTLKRSENGDLTVDVSALNGVDVTVITGDAVRLQVRAQISAPGVIATSVDKRAYKIGDVLPDGWVVGPVSPDTGKPIAIEPVSGALEGFNTWYRGEDHAADLRHQGHASARQPTAGELNATYNKVVNAGHNQHARFNTRSSYPHGKYWTSTTSPGLRDHARVQYFDDGLRHWDYKDGAYARVRCVRDEPGLTLA